MFICRWRRGDENATAAELGIADEAPRASAVFTIVTRCRILDAGELSISERLRSHPY